MNPTLRTIAFGVVVLLGGEVVGLTHASGLWAFAAGFAMSLLAVPTTRWIRKGDVP